MEKCTLLAKILHCRRQWRQWQIPPLPSTGNYWYVFTFTFDTWNILQLSHHCSVLTRHPTWEDISKLLLNPRIQVGPNRIPQDLFWKADLSSGWWTTRESSDSSALSRLLRCSPSSSCSPPSSSSTTSDNIPGWAAHSSPLACCLAAPAPSLSGELLNSFRSCHLGPLANKVTSCMFI